MVFAEDDNVIKAFSPYAPIQSLRVRILPGAPWSGQNFFHAHGGDLSLPKTHPPAFGKDRVRMKSIDD